MPAMDYMPSRSMHSRKDCPHSGMANPNVSASLRLDKTEFLGRIAGKGYSEVGMGTIRGFAGISSNSTILDAKPCHEVEPLAVK